MSLHSFSSCWLHIVFNTLNREKIINKDLRVKLSQYFSTYSKEKGIYHKINFVNAEHVHLLIDLPTNLTIEQAVQLYKGSSSNWVNKNNFNRNKFYWGRGYGVLSVSQGKVSVVSNYIANQEEHHRVKSFAEEYEKFMRLYNQEHSL